MIFNAILYLSILYSFFIKLWFKFLSAHMWCLKCKVGPSMKLCSLGPTYSWPGPVLVLPGYMPRSLPPSFGPVWEALALSIFLHFRFLSHYCYVDICRQYRMLIIKSTAVNNTSLYISFHNWHIFIVLTGNGFLFKYVFRALPRVCANKRSAK